MLALASPATHESSPRPGNGQRHDAPLANSRFRSRFRHRPRVRRRFGDRRLFRRLQAAQPAAPDVRRRRLFAGLRADTRRIQEQAWRPGNAAVDRPRDQHPRAGAVRHHRHRRRRRACAGLDLGAGFRRRCGQVRIDRHAHPHHLSLHLLHVAGCARRRHSQHHEPLCLASLHAGTAQRIVHRHGAVRRTLLRPTGSCTGLGGLPWRRSPAGDPDSRAAPHRHVAATVV